MDAISQRTGLAYAKALASQDAIFAAFAKADHKPKEQKDEIVILNAQFQLLAAAQKNIDEANKAALAEGVGGGVDAKA